jgi:hypothetical protein
MIRFLCIFFSLFIIYSCSSKKQEPDPASTTKRTSAPKPPKPTEPPTPPSKPQDPEIAPSAPSDLTEFLSTGPYIAKEVAQLALKGVAPYDNSESPITIARAQAKKSYKSPAGRGNSWIKNTFGDDEDTLLNMLKKVDPPKTFTLKEIRELYNNITNKNPRNNKAKAKFILTTDVNINYLHESPRAHHAFVQLASQFNYLEAAGPHIATVTSYVSDKTQGPMGSIEAAAAALHRRATIENGTLKHALIDVLPEGHENYYKDGYLELYKIPTDDEKKALHEHIKNTIENMAILPQWVINEAGGIKNIQVFAAAPSYQGHKNVAPLASSEEGHLVRLLVKVQYEAIAKMAVIRSILTNKEVNVHLTRVGQGAFENPPETMGDAFSEVAQAVRGYDRVFVYIHGFDQDQTDKNKAQIDKKKLISYTELDRDSFFKNN